MRLATIRTATGLQAVRGPTPGWRARAEAADCPSHALDALDHAPFVPRPGEMICVGLRLDDPRRHDALS